MENQRGPFHVIIIHYEGASIYKFCHNTHKLLKFIDRYCMEGESEWDLYRNCQSGQIDIDYLLDAAIHISRDTPWRLAYCFESDKLLAGMSKQFF
jgi:hypothetical protein